MLDMARNSISPFAWNVNLNYAATATKKLFRVPVCQVSMDFPLFEVIGLTLTSGWFIYIGNLDFSSRANIFLGSLFWIPISPMFGKPH
jgi:hypothetical protein